MSKILLALAILSAGAGGFLTARHSTMQLQHKAQATRESWLTQTQQLAAVQSEQADLAARILDLKTSLAQRPTVPENALWVALQKIRTNPLPPELREHVLEELGFNWQTSPDFIVVTKQTVRDTGSWMLRNGILSEVAAAVLAMAAGERAQVLATLQRAQADFNDWASAHIERKEPKEGDLAHYFLPGDTAMVQSIRHNLVAGILTALGKDRAEIMEKSVRNWMRENVGVGANGTTLVVRREPVGSEQRLKAEKHGDDGVISAYYPEADLPATFRPIFPNGWADLAKREGFELPPPPQKK